MKEYSDEGFFEECFEQACDELKIETDQDRRTKILESFSDDLMKIFQNYLFEKNNSETFQNCKADIMLFLKKQSINMNPIFVR